ncbi:MAG: 3-phosphoshikimate 1-carboxyvinyltransferase [Clostridia bacterium]|nr:3-phosphoshikimate 1-carboxyvinyltransferase [Clostridia bacterium]
MKVTVNGKNLKGSIGAIASKSMAHRYLICSALSDSVTGVRCETRSDDISVTAGCLRAMGTEISYSDGGYFIGKGKSVKRPTLDCGESGSTLRFLLPVVAALGNGGAFVRGTRLQVRPIKALTQELVRHGCTVSDEMTDPLRVGGKLLSGYYELPGDVSSQFISGLLFALPLCDGDSTLKINGKIESLPYIDMTLSALETFGIKIEKTDTGYFIPGNQKYVSPGTAQVEGDWSGASFWLCAGALGADVTVTGLSESSLQGDKKIVDELGKLKTDGKVFLDAADIPDLVPVLSVAAAAREGTTVIYNAGRLRIKESDRLKTTCNMLCNLGVSCSETEDGLKIVGGGLRPGTVRAENDHRIAMSAAVASVVAGDVTVEGAEAVSKSYPAFWEDFKRLGGTVVFED